MIDYTFIINDFNFFYSHRFNIVSDLLEKKKKVCIISGNINYKKELLLKNLKVSYYKINLDRKGTLFFNEIILFLKLFSILLFNRPKVVHLITIKPILYAGLICRLLNINTVFAITGLNFIKYLKKSLNKLTFKILIKLLSFVVNHKSSKIIVQNTYDMEYVIKNYQVSKDKIYLIKGSGVDLEKFFYIRQDYKIPKIILPARMLWDKGINEFIKANKIVNKNKIIARFILVGPYDPNNINAINYEILEALSKNNSNGEVEWWGNIIDMNNVYSKAAIVVLPSYAEGFPKVIQEAAACGKFVITTNVPGCIDSVDINKTGDIVPVNDYIELSEKIVYYINNNKYLEEAVHLSRKKAENEFDIKIIIKQHQDIYDLFK